MPPETVNNEYVYVYTLDSTAASLIAISFALFIVLPIATWAWFVSPLWRSGGTSGWIARGGGGRMHSTARGAKRRTPPPALVSFRDVHYSVTLPGRERQELHVLKGVSGVLRPGTLTAIMGPSGCGKSTLLDVLADTKRVGVVEGDVRLNGSERGPDFRATCAYVMQEDCCHSTLTVRETLWFVCALRLGPDIGRHERLELIDATMEDVDLAHVADTRIGDDVSGGLSGGQRRRVTIAIELLSGPALVLLDEPTSGLDAYGAQQVVASLRRFADRGRTLACTIHQPRAETFKLFHQLLLIKAGETMYCGPVAQVPDFLRGCGVPCPPSVNPADVVVDLTHTKEADADEDGGDMVDLVARFAKSDLRRQIEAEIDLVEIGRHPALADLAAQSLKAPQEEEGRGGCCGGGGGGGGYPNPLMHQVGVLVRRQWTLDMRDFGYKFTWVWLDQLRVCLAPFLEGVGPRIGIPSQVLNGFVLALNASTYLLVAQPPLDAQPASVYRDDMGCSASIGSGDGVQGCVCHLGMSTPSADGAYTVADDVAECGQALVARTNVDFAHRGFLFLVVNALFINEAVFVPTIIADKRFFAREHGARAYSVLAWHLAWLVKLGLTAALKALFYTPCFYFLGQLRLDATAYLAAAFATGGMGFAGSAVAMLITTLIPGLGAATTAFGCAVLLYQNVCGFFLPIRAIPPYLLWLAWSSVFTYGYYAIINSQQLGTVMTGAGENVEDRLVFAFCFVLYAWCFLFHGVAYAITRAYSSHHATYLGRDGPRSTQTRRRAAAAAAAGGGAAAAPSPSPPLGETAAIADLRPPPVTPPDEVPSPPPTPKSSSKRQGGLATPASATSTPSRWSRVRDVVSGADASRGDGAAALRGQYPLSPLRRTLDQVRAQLVMMHDDAARAAAPLSPPPHLGQSTWGRAPG